MSAAISDQVIDFYQALFGAIFSAPFAPAIADRLKRNAVIRQTEEAADAASQSLVRFFLNERLTEEETAAVLAGFAGLPALLKLEVIANPNVSPEALAEELLQKLPVPGAVRRSKREAAYRVALHSILQGLMLVGPVMAEWRRLDFSRTFELPRRVIEKLNDISRQMAALGAAGRDAEDERYELSYRDYLLQRFYRVEAGTVRMTTNMAVDLRELFVMPRVVARPQRAAGIEGTGGGALSPMDLAAAREFLRGVKAGAEADEDGAAKKKKRQPVAALKQVERAERSVIVGLPGSGKSTFLEWLQLKIAAAPLKRARGREHSIPLLLRVRQLEAKRLPADGAALIEKATGSKDRAALMPAGWLERQMEAGRVLFMLDGLDETEPELCDDYVIPWLAELCLQYPQCGFLVSSRPVGYPPGALREFKFVECDLQDFGEEEIAEYARHWCVAIRLSQNEPEEEARREGHTEGEQIFQDFQEHPYIKNLARNPLMLSAICLVNYFERGKLPQDRALLYKLCVEGLLHHWDQRRGIHSDFGLEEKLRACREVAIAMQKDDRAEYEATRVQKIFRVVLGDTARGERLFEHIRYRTGLLLERRAGFYAFAHLTFQEYLAALAVYEGNRSGVDAAQLVREHNDGRWGEVIALYCGLAAAPAARSMLEQLICQPNTDELAEVLAEAYFSSGAQLTQNKQLKRKIMERVAVAPIHDQLALGRFAPTEVAAIANSSIGRMEGNHSYSNSSSWLHSNPKFVDETILLKRIKNWKGMTPFQLTEVSELLHRYGSSAALAEIASYVEMYQSPALKFEPSDQFVSQAERAFIHLLFNEFSSSLGFEAVSFQIIHALSKQDFNVNRLISLYILRLFLKHIPRIIPDNYANRNELSSLLRAWAKQLSKSSSNFEGQDQYFIKANIKGLNAWANALDRASATKAKQPSKAQTKATSKTAARSTAKKATKRRR